MQRPALLTARDALVCGGIFDAQHQPITGAFRERFSDVEGERDSPALVLAQELAIEPNRGTIIDCAEVQQHVLATPAFGDGNSTRIPEHRMKARILDA